MEQHIAYRVFWVWVVFVILLSISGYISTYRDLMVTYQVSGESIGSFHSCTIEVKYAKWSTHDVKGAKIYQAVIEKEKLKTSKIVINNIFKM